MSDQPLLLDLFSGAGGAGRGYQLAGFATVGVDLDAPALRRYPGPAVRADALQVLGGGLDLDRFAAIHASPPCQAYSVTRHTHRAEHPDLLRPVLDALTAWGQRTGRPWVVENVPGAPMPGALVLCGSEFGLAAQDSDGSTLHLRRHRLFLSNRLLMGAGGCHCAAHRGRIGGVYGGGSRDREHARTVRKGGYTPGPDVARALLGVPWMTHRQAAQCIPAAYTEHIGSQLLDQL